MTEQKPRLDEYQLTKDMEDTLLLLGYGVSYTVDGFVSLDDPDACVDMRSVNALGRRGLVGVQYGAASGMLVSSLGLTEAGWIKFYMLEEAAYQAVADRRRWR